MSYIAENHRTIGKALLLAEEYLRGCGVPEPKSEAEYLLAHVFSKKRTELYLNHAETFSDIDDQRLKRFIERRARREPSQYILGFQEFRGLEFKVTPDVLIPRPETELLVEEAVTLASGGREVGCGKMKTNSIPLVTIHNSQFTILDLCTGSGCIAVSIAKEIPFSRVIAVDVSQMALNVSKENAEINGVSDRITFFKGNLFEPLKGFDNKFNIIVSNPPYISNEEMKKIEQEISQHEPRIALYGGEDGLDFFRRIIAESSQYLVKDGYLLLEMGYGQADNIKKLIEQSSSFKDISIVKDIAGIDRVIRAQRK